MNKIAVFAIFGWAFVHFVIFEWNFLHLDIFGWVFVHFDAKLNCDGIQTCRDKSRAPNNSPKIHSKIRNTYGWTSMKTIKLSQIDAFSLMIKAQTTIHLARCGCWRKTLKIIWQSSCAKDSNNTNQVSKLWKQRAKCHVIISKNAKIK